MLKRTITGIISAALLIAVMFIRGWLFDAVVAVAVLLGSYEMLGAFSQAGFRPPKLSVYGMAVLSLPAFWVFGAPGIFVIACAGVLLIHATIALRKEPRWTDAAAALGTLVGTVLPMMMFYPILRILPEVFGALLAFLILVIAYIGDTFAYFIGVTMGRHAMAPSLSPKKTWEGAAAGLIGSVAGAAAIYALGVNVTQMPPAWHFLILGIVGGVAAQLGDLSASLVKRHCGIKDFGSVFPGHGGMMDRLDSVVFVAFVVFGYCLTGGLV